MMKVCFVGIGSIGKRHIRNLSKVCCKKNIKLEIHALRTSDKSLEDDVDEMIQKTFLKVEDVEDKYDAVFITNPTYKHFETIEKFLNKTDVFFVEKPVFETVERDISKFVEAKKKFYVACPLRYTNVLLEAKKIIEKEKMFSARAICSSYLPDWRKGVDYRNVYSAHKDQGGGVRIDLIHEWDYLSWLFGIPSQVCSFSGKYSNLEIDSEDLAIYIAEYSDKLVELHLDYFGRKSRRSLELRTAEHEYVFDIVNSRILVDDLVYKEYYEETNDKYIREMENFLSIILENSQSNNDLNLALEILKVTNL